ncbi:hypothetical protein J4573_52120 [Actinomadura barringtoniae]|uniref:DUF6801 domain-containing protein n=1 Tax=Actinomadura barringtoniae TaxID=1427535 RepID=A0A939PVD2_9ACTN|nr:DUF6801 domain-containing protein [Actinomadura barringtoniae]MBO2455704.1 hypothetical protein [Actinomadura barringtoniae]
MRFLGKATAIGLSAFVVGSMSGGGASASSQDADVSLTYACQFPSGPQQVAVRVQGTFPSNAVVGKPIQPSRITTTVTIPEAGVADVGEAGGDSVVGTAQLTTAVTQNGTSNAAKWSGLTSAPTAVPAEGSLPLSARGTVPATKTAAAGDLSFSAGDLALTLSPSKAGGSKLAVDCTPAARQARVLATVPVSKPGSAQKPNAVPKAEPTIPPECGKWAGPPKETPDGWIDSGCTYMSGFANVKKLNGATVFNDGSAGKPALINIVYAVPGVGDSEGSIRQKLVEPIKSKSTFLTFGFMPTTAAMEMIQAPLAPGKDYGTYEVATGNVVTAHMKMTIRITGASANGSALSVGKRCQTRVPADIVLKGTVKSVLEEGVLEGPLTIPSFSGCGTGGDDLSRLFSASVSGPGNLMRVSVGATCLPSIPQGCPPVVPVPQRTAPAAG